jgi:hypothetical protein
MVPEHPVFSLSRSPKTSPPSRLSTTLALPRPVASVAAVAPSSAVVASVARSSEEAVVASSESVLIVVGAEIVSSITAAVAVDEVVALDGRTTTSPSATGTAPSPSDRNGPCSKRSTSTGCRSSIWTRLMVKISTTTDSSTTTIGRTTRPQSKVPSVSCNLSIGLRIMSLLLPTL